MVSLKVCFYVIHVILVFQNGTEKDSPRDQQRYALRHSAALTITRNMPIKKLNIIIVSKYIKY